MDDKNEAPGETANKLEVAHPGPPSIDDLLRHVDPAPDAEIERFVAAIYAHRREAKAIPAPE